MEIKATLQKPFTFEQKRDFIILQNRQNGYEIRETETELQAWGYTEEEKEEQEKERIGNLTCTKRVLVLALKEQFGVNYYNQILPLINSDEMAKLEWELCEKLERKNPMLDEFAEKLNILPAQIDDIFIKANL